MNCGAACRACGYDFSETTASEAHSETPLRLQRRGGRAAL